MKTLWNVLSFLAVVHLLALAMFIAWLWQSDRLDMQRIHDARAMFAATLTQVEAERVKARSEEESAKIEKAQEDREADPPLDSASQIQYISIIKQEEEQARRRLEAERNMLLQQLGSASSDVEQKRTDFERQRLAWEGAAKSQIQSHDNEQFLRTVRQYEQLSPKQGKKMLAELVRQDKMDQVVAYLDAMNVRNASKILKEFKTDEEIDLATELLERLRTFGKTPANAPADTSSAAARAGTGPAQEPGNASRPAIP